MLPPVRVPPAAPATTPSPYSAHSRLALHARLRDTDSPIPFGGDAIDMAVALYWLWADHAATLVEDSPSLDLHLQLVRSFPLHDGSTPAFALAYAVRRNGTTGPKAVFFHPQDAQAAIPFPDQQDCHRIQRDAIALLAAVRGEPNMLPWDARHIHHRFDLWDQDRLLGHARLAWDNTQPPGCGAIVRLLRP